MKNLYKNILNFDLKATLTRWLSSINRPVLAAFLTAFLTLNLIFLYHGAHFLFGDHDWKYLKQGIKLTDGLFEGRFSQFLLINFLTSGDILPYINNLIGFLGYSLGIALLGYYWKLPNQKKTYIIFSLFIAVTPYLLSFMYFAFLIPAVLSWNAVVIAALIISEKETRFSIKKTFFSVLLLTLALGGYPPVINLIGTALVARLLFALYDDKKDCQCFKQTPDSNAPKTNIKEESLNDWCSTPPLPLYDFRYTFLNITLALICYKLCLLYFTHTGEINTNYYNLQTIMLTDVPQKLMLMMQNVIKQFTITLPFITLNYKIITGGLSILAILSLLNNNADKGTNKILRTSLKAILIMGIFVASLATFFISTSRAETEFSPRVDFFGFVYAIAAMLALCLKSNKIWQKNLAYAMVIIAVIISIKTQFYAQKVWKLGFDAEMSYYRRIQKRYEQNELFNPKNRYIIVQAGSPAFRKKYYDLPYNHASDDLLDISYTPGLNSGVMWNYYSPFPYADETSYVYTFNPTTEFKQQLAKAVPYPHPESIAVGPYWILLPLTQQNLQYLRNRYN